MSRYTNQEIEKLLSRAIAAQTPDILQHVQKMPQSPEIVFDPMVPIKRNKKRGIYMFAVCFVCLMLIFVGFFYLQTDTNITLSGIPSVGIEINRFERVLAVKAFSPEAEEILSGLELKGTTLDTAVNSIIGALKRHEYLNEDDISIQVTAIGRDGGHQKELEMRISRILAVPETRTESPSDLPQGKEDTDSFSNATVSENVINQLLNAVPQLNKEDLQHLSIQELCELADELDIDIYDNNGRLLDDDDFDED